MIILSIFIPSKLKKRFPKFYYYEESAFFLFNLFILVTMAALSFIRIPGSLNNAICHANSYDV